jgi:hypothetical protein
LAISCKDVKTRLGNKISKFTGINRTSRGSARSWKICGVALRNINLSGEAEMWAAIRKNWDYLALTFVLGVYVTATVAVAITLILALSVSF